MTSRHSPWAEFTAALLVLVGWLGPAFVWGFVPTVTVPEEYSIEPGGAFGIFYFLFVPYVAASLWVVPSSLAAMAFARSLWPLSLLLSGLNATALACLAAWIRVGDFDQLLRVQPHFDTASTLGAVAVGAAVLTMIAAVTDEFTGHAPP